MTDTRAELKTQMARYIVADNALQTANSVALDLRRDKKLIEAQMSDLLQNAEFANINALQNEAGDAIKIQRPGGWNKGWSLSKRELETYLDDYFARTSAPDAKECLGFIVESNKKTASEFSFTRTN